MRVTITLDLPNGHPWVTNRPGVLDIMNDDATVFAVRPDDDLGFSDDDETRYEGTVLEEDL